MGNIHVKSYGIWNASPFKMSVSNSVDQDQTTAP